MAVSMILPSRFNVLPCTPSGGKLLHVGYLSLSLPVSTHLSSCSSQRGGPSLIVWFLCLSASSRSNDSIWFPKLYCSRFLVWIVLRLIGAHMLCSIFSRSWKRHCSWCHQKALGSCNLRVWKTSRQEKNNSTSQKQLCPCVFMAFRLQYTDARRDTRTKLPKGLKEGLYTHVFTHVFTTKYKHTSHKIVWIKLGSFCPCPDSQACAGAHWSESGNPKSDRKLLLRFVEMAPQSPWVIHVNASKLWLIVLAYGHSKLTKTIKTAQAARDMERPLQLQVEACWSDQAFVYMIHRKPLYKFPETLHVCFLCTAGLIMRCLFSLISAWSGCAWALGLGSTERTRTRGQPRHSARKIFK